MLMDKDLEIELLKLQVENLSKCVRIICSELIQTGMAENSPPHREMIAMGGCGLGIFEVLGVGEDGYCCE